MHIKTLQTINTACRQLQAVALLTELGSGEQYLYYGDDPDKNTQLPQALAEQAAEALKLDNSQIFEHDSQSIFIQPFNPPLRMIVVGAVHITQALVSMARQCDYQVTLVDPRQAFASEQRFPHTQLLHEWPDVAIRALAPDQRTAIITLSHDPKLDDPALEIALNSKAFYIGSLGSRRTHRARIQRLSEKGFTEAQQARIQAPIGLDIGARSPAEIAIAIMAEVTQAYRKSS